MREPAKSVLVKTFSQKRKKKKEKKQRRQRQKTSKKRKKKKPRERIRALQLSARFSQSSVKRNGQSNHSKNEIPDNSLSIQQFGTIITYFFPFFFQIYRVRAVFRNARRIKGKFLLLLFTRRIRLNP